MDSQVKLILELMKQDKEIRDHLFEWSSMNDKNDFSVYFNEENDYSHIDWIYESSQQEAALIGIGENDEVYAIESEGMFFSLCNGFQNVPYEFIRIGCQYTDHELVSEYFVKYIGINLEPILKRYESWCKANGIELDKDKVYHDSNGKLFEKYFEKE